MGTKCLFGILALVTVASATVWSPGRSYNYQFNGWIVTGIPEIDQQFAGVHLSGRFVVEPETDNTIVFALKDTTARKFNQVVDKSIRKSPELWEELGEVVDIMDKNILEKPAMITFKGDEFESLTVSSNEPLWAINMKKALAVKLQLQISEGKGSKGAFEKLESGEKRMYPVMENCVVGECEVWYEISELPEERIKSDPKLVPSPQYCKSGVFYEIVKTVNFDKCVKSPVMAHVSPHAWKCVPGTNTCGSSKTRSVTVRTIGCGTTKKDFIVQRQVTVDTEMVKPFGSDTEPIEAVNYIKLELESVQSSRSLSEPKGEKIHSLIFAHSPQQLNGGPLPQPGLKDPILRRHPPIKVLEKEIRRLLSEVVRDLESNEFLMAPEKFGVSGKIGMIRRAAAVLPYDELKSIFSRELAMNQETTENQVVMTVLSNAGTNPAILLVKEQILKGKLSGERARQSVSFLPVTLKTPTVGILNELVDLLESKVADQDPIFESTLSMSLASIIYQACVNKTLSRSQYPTLVMGDFCSPSEPLIVKKLIPFLAKKIENADSNYEKLSFLTALGNLGHEGILPIIASVIEGEENLEHVERSWHAKHGLPSEFGAYKSGAMSAYEFEEEELEELANMAKGKKGTWTKKYFEELIKGKKTKRSLRSRFEEDYFGSRTSKGRQSGQEEEEEEEYELTNAQRRNYGIPEHLKINKGILKKYGVPMEEVRKSEKWDEETEEYELTKSQRRRYGVPEHEKINMGILKKYGVPTEEASPVSRGTSGSKSYFEEEGEEEYELTSAQRRRYSIPSHIEKINKGVLRKYGVPVEEVRETSTRKGGKSGRSDYWGAEEEEEEYELSHSQRKMYGIPAGEKLNKGVLKKYGVPLETAEASRVEKRGSRKSEESEWGTKRASRGGSKRRGRSGKSHKRGGKGRKETEEYESDLIPRIRAVWSLRRLALAHNPKAIHLLGSIFFNTNEDPEVRIAAANLIFVGDAPVTMWERVAVGTWFEPSYQVRHFVATSIYSISTMENPTHRSHMVKAKAVLPLVKPIEWSFVGSSNYVGSYYDANEDTGYMFQAATMFSNSSFLPLKSFVDLQLKQGHFDFSVVKFGILGQQLSKLVSRMLPGKWGRWRSSEKVHPDVKRILDFLNIESETEDEAPEAYVYMKLMDGIERIWPLTEETPEHLVGSFADYFKSRGDNINYRKWASLADTFAVVPMEMGLPLLVENRWKTLNSWVGNVNVSSDEVEAELAGNFGFKIISVLSFDVPFVNKIVSSGVDMNTFISMPATMCAKVDKSRSKVAVEWEPMRGKISALHYHVKPFTATKDFFDLTPIDQVTDIKRVTVHEGPLEVQIPLSEKLFGVETNFVGLKAYITHKADSKKLTYLTTLNHIASAFSEGKIANRLMGIPSDLRYRETKFVLDMPASETKAIRINFEIAAAAQPISEDITVIRSGSSRVSEASPSLKERVELIYGKLDETKTENFISVFETTIGGQAVTVDASIELISTVAPRKYEASVTLGRGGLGLVQKGSIHVQHRSGQGSNTKICVDGEVNWPKLTSLKREYFLGTDLTTAFSFTVGYGSNCEKKRGFAIEGKMMQTAEQIAYAKSSPEALLCKKLEMQENVMVASEECEEARKQASDLDRYEIEFDYPSSPSELVSNFTTKVENLLKFVGYRYLSENSNVKNTNRKVKLVVDLESSTKDIANIEIFSPRSNIFFTGVPLGAISRTTLPINVRLPLIANILNTHDICALEGNRVNTFDNTVYEAELSGCDHVLATDCLDVTILGREEKGGKVATIIYMGDKVILNPASKKVTINGNEQALVEDKVVISVDESGMTNLIVREIGDGFYEVVLPGVGKVTVSSDKIIIGTNGLNRGPCSLGMCGTGNREPLSDLTGPRGCTLSSGKHLAIAYMLETPKGSCGSERKHEESLREFKKEQEACLKGEPYSNLAKVLEDVVQSRWSPVGSDRSVAECTSFRNRMITRGGLKCFSTVAIPECRPGCKAINKIEKKIGFHCVPKGRLSEHLLEEYQSRPLNELLGKEDQTYDSLSVPTSCI